MRVPNAEAANFAAKFTFAFCCLWTVLFAEHAAFGTTEDLQIKRTVTSSRNPVTGLQRTNTKIDLRLRGRVLGSNEIRDLINAASPGLTAFPEIWDAVELGSNDVLTLMSADSQGRRYPVVRFKMTNGKLKAEVVKLGESGSSVNWFPDSRISGWTRVLGDDQNQYLIRSEPFQVVNIGRGQIVKAEFPLVFLAETGANAEPVLKVINILTEEVQATLDLDPHCFQMPEFSFDHPSLDRNSSLESDQRVTYPYGPRWWDKNFTFVKESPARLLLKSNHVLDAPPAKMIAIVENDRNVSPLDRHPKELDRFPFDLKGCKAINPNGFERAIKSQPLIESAFPEQLCLDDNLPIAASTKPSVCGSATRKTSFQSGEVKVNSVNFTYRSQNKIPKQAELQVSVNEIETPEKRIRYLTSDRDDSLDALADFLVLNDKRLLFRARSQGPWKVYLVSIHGAGFEAVLIDQYPFPGSGFEDSSDGKFIYLSDAGILLRREPLQVIRNAGQILAVHDQRVVTYRLATERDGVKSISFSVWSLTDPERNGYSWKSAPLWEGKLNTSCLQSDFRSLAESTLKAREIWFQQNLSWSPDGRSLALSASGDKSKQACRWINQ